VVRPDGQALQEVDDGAVEYVPGGQPEQGAKPVGEKEPASHAAVGR
jgi:hypothetical protein